MRKNTLLVSPANSSYYTLTAPLGLSYVARAMNDVGLNVLGLDLSVHRYIYQMEDKLLYRFIERIINKYDIGFLCISVLEETFRDAVTIAEIAKNSNCVVIAGGMFPTMYPETFPDCFDYLVRGDAEHVDAQLIKAIINGGDISEISGIAYWDQGKMVLQGEPVPVNCKEDVIPMREIFDEFNFGFYYKTARLISSRGCIYSCSFCTNTMENKGFLRRKVEGIIQEIIYLIDSQGMDYLIFSDDQFMGTELGEYESSYKILSEVKDLLIENNVRVNFQARVDQLIKCFHELPEFFSLLSEISSEYIDLNATEHMKLHGKFLRGIEVDVGIESFCDTTLKKYRKGVTSRQNMECLKILSECNVDIGAYMIPIHPFVTLEELQYDFTQYEEYYLRKGYLSHNNIINFFKPLLLYQGCDIRKSVIQSGLFAEPRNYHFQDHKTSLFYITIATELVELCKDEQYTPEDIISVIHNLFDYCNKKDTRGCDLLSSVVSDGDNTDIVEDIYKKYYES